MTAIRLNERLKSSLSTLAVDKTISVIVRWQNGQEAALKTLLEAAGITIDRKLPLVKGFAIEGNKAQIESLLEREDLILSMDLNAVLGVRTNEADKGPDKQKKAGKKERSPVPLDPLLGDVLELMDDRSRQNIFIIWRPGKSAGCKTLLEEQGIEIVETDNLARKFAARVTKNQLLELQKRSDVIEALRFDPAVRSGGEIIGYRG